MGELFPQTIAFQMENNTPLEFPKGIANVQQLHKYITNRFHTVCEVFIKPQTLAIMFTIAHLYQTWVQWPLLIYQD